MSLLSDMICIIVRRGGLFHDKAMKPTVPETGKIIKVEDSSALVMIEGGKGCKDWSTWENKY
jgi:hypothetical protein